jgi:hypothetical protein
MEFLRDECGLLFPQACTVLDVYESERARVPGLSTNVKDADRENITIFSNEYSI